MNCDRNLSPGAEWVYGKECVRNIVDSGRDGLAFYPAGYLPIIRLLVCQALRMPLYREMLTPAVRRHEMETHAGSMVDGNSVLMSCGDSGGYRMTSIGTPMNITELKMVWILCAVGVTAAEMSVVFGCYTRHPYSSCKGEDIPF